MTEQLLQTKLYIPPLRATLVSRPRLLEKLSQGQAAHLLLITAPAGFGKTTLITEWLATRQTSTTAWLSLDDGDNDPSRFYGYLVAALQTIDPDIGHGVQDYLRSTQMAAVTPESVVTLLLNDLARRSQSGLLVLDDYHTIHTPAIHQAIQFWLDNQPPNFQLALTSRSTPPLALSRLRVRHQIVEIDADELRFTPAESAKFLNRVMKLDLAPEDVARLAARTEGWIASIQLAALSLQGQPDPHNFVLNFAGDDRFVMDYLMEEVLQRQPGYIRDFLLQTSILGRLNVQLCNAVTGQVGSQQILEDLDQANLFVIPLDNRRHWYRYHHLFAEFLRAQLERTNPAQISDLHRAATRWYATHGYAAQAIEHALLAQDFASAADLIAQSAEELLWREGQFATLLRWGQSLPDGVWQNHPRLALTRAWALYTSGEWDAIEKELPRLERLVAQETDPGLAAQWQGELLVLQAERAIYRSDIAQARRLFQQAEGFLLNATGLAMGMLHQGLGYVYRLEGAVAEALSSLENARRISQEGGYLAAQLFCLFDIAAVHHLAGNLETALAAYAEMERITGRADHPLVTSMDVIRGQIFHEQGRLDEADACLTQALGAAQRTGMTGFVRVTHLALARLRQSQGRQEEAQASLEAVAKLNRHSKVYWVLAQAEMIRARLFLAQDRVDVLGEWAASVTKPAAERPFVPQVQSQQEQIVYARYLLASGELSACDRLLAGLHTHAEVADWHSHLLEIEVVAALCAQARSQSTDALKYLESALGLSESSGSVQILLDEAAALHPLLERAARGGKYPRTAGSILARIPAQEAPTPHTSISLTRREREILRLLAAGLSNQQIADELTIALGTVGKHTSNIFVKLDAPNRAAAVLAASELGLV